MKKYIAIPTFTWGLCWLFLKNYNMPDGFVYVLWGMYIIGMINGIAMRTIDERTYRRIWIVGKSYYK